MAGKRPISERPAGAQNRSRVGHLEADTVIGTSSDKHCVLTFVDRKTGYAVYVPELALVVAGAVTEQSRGREVFGMIDRAVGLIAGGR